MALTLALVSVASASIIHDFVMLHPLAGTHAAKAPTAQGAAFLRDALHGS